jgi:hypothetical protein
VFATTIFFHLNLIFASNNGLHSGKPCLKYQTRVKANVSAKHSSFLPHGNSHNRKKFYSTGPFGVNVLKLSLSKNLGQNKLVRLLLAYTTRLALAFVVKIREGLKSTC